jgi:hypothetical protein
MNKEYINKTALQTAVEHLKSNDLPLSEMRKFANDVLDLEDKFGEEIPNSELAALTAKHPELMRPVMATLIKDTENTDRNAEADIRRKLGIE